MILMSLRASEYRGARGLARVWDLLKDRAASGLIAIALIAMGLVIGACILGASADAVSLGGVPLFGGLGLVVGVALGIYVFVKTRPYLK